MTLRKKGFSLIEVVIALAIFVIGALAVIRIFPTGLSLVEKSGNEQLAANLNRSIVARRLNTKSVPEAIFDGDFRGATSTGTADHHGYRNVGALFNGAVSGSAKFNDSLPKGITSTQLNGSALDRFQAIRGERTIVRNSTGSGLCVFTQSSIWVDAPASVSKNAAIYREFNVENVTVNATGTLNWANANKTGSTNPFNPLVAATITPAVLNNFVFYATYRYTDASGRVWQAEEEPIVDAATTLRRIVNIVPGGVEIKARQWIQTTDFGLSTTTDEDKSKARCGLIKFTSSTVPPVIGETVYVDYVTNWYWILEETSSPSNVDSNLYNNLTPLENYRQVELAIPFVRPRSTQRFATLLMGGGGDGAHYASTYSSSGFLPTTTRVAFPADNSNLRSSLREGKIAFDITGVPSPLIRVAYRTQDDWAEQLSVSAQTYKRDSSLNGATPLDWVTGVESWRNYELESNILVFQPSEAGKSVRVTYSYSTASGDKVKTELLTISNQITAHGSLSVARATINPPGGGGVTAILSVKGASITSRTAWMTNDSYSHNLLTSLRSDS